jgi:hypothetical protein
MCAVVARCGPTTLFGASLGGALAPVRLILRETEAAAQAGGRLQAKGRR